MKESTSCHLCGSKTFEWGQLRSQGIKFIPDDASWTKKQFSFGTDIKARRCTSCNNIQIFSE